MSLLDDFKKQFGMKTFNTGVLNAGATTTLPVIPETPVLTTPLEGITITEEYKQIKALIEAGSQIVFVSGKAGTGKSTLITYLRRSLKENVVVVAPTGIAALNVNGVTLHSYFRLPPRIANEQDISKVKDRKLYTHLDLLIVDEISMVRADAIDAIDAFLRKNGRDKDRPFGGTKLLLVGDLFQLPPVVTQAEQKVLDYRGYESPYFFGAKSLQFCEMATIELREIFRQRDPEFTSILNDIRVAQNLDKVIPALNQRCAANTGDPSVITLTSTNAAADEANSNGLSKLDGEEKTYLGQIEGKFMVEEERLPSPVNLTLKIGAQVMFTKNDETRRWVNGSLGRVVELQDDLIMVEMAGEQQRIIHGVTPVEWKSYKYEYSDSKEKIVPEVAGRYIQYPLMLAWAVTIHKSQGQTLDRVRVDLGPRAFASGQVYVALSRCRSMEGINLARPVEINEVKCDPVVEGFYGHLAGGAYEDRAKTTAG